MNITLSADGELIEKSRRLAREKGTSLNQVIRDYLADYVDERKSSSVADEFERLVREASGRSSAGYRFSREGAHERR